MYITNSIAYGYSCQLSYLLGKTALKNWRSRCEGSRETGANQHIEPHSCTPVQLGRENWMEGEWGIKAGLR